MKTKGNSMIFSIFTVGRLPSSFLFFSSYPLHSTNAVKKKASEKLVRAWKKNTPFSALIHITYHKRTDSLHSNGFVIAKHSIHWFRLCNANFE